MRFIFLSLLLVMAQPAHAAGIALVLVNDSYEALGEHPDIARMADSVSLLEAAGFQVVSGRNLTAEDMRAQAAGAFDMITRDPADRVVIVLAGHFARSTSGTWFLGAEADQPGLVMADGVGLRMETLLEMAAYAQSSALVWLVDISSRESFGAGLEAGLPPRLVVPQNVGVVRGDTHPMIAGLRAVLRPGTIVPNVIDGDRALSGEGTLRPLVPFLPDGFAPSASADRQAWATALEADSEDAYAAYLDAFPNGLNAQAARIAIERIKGSPERIEENLQLTRDERRAIQRDLTVLDHNPRGIDGIFGPATRTAIRAWQEGQGAEATGFLTRAQVTALAQQGTRRAAEIELAERAAREARERDDRDFWVATGAGLDEAALRAYLARYPEGIFAGLANERLAAIVAEAEAAREQQDWARAQRADRIPAYEAYLRDWPEGRFSERAQARIAQLQPTPEPAPAPDTSPHAARENALGLTQSTRLLIERRLAQIGFDPGPVDGVFDDRTRLAIRQAQRRYDLPVTGYVTQDLMTMMLSEAFRRIFD